MLLPWLGLSVLISAAVLLTVYSDRAAVGARPDGLYHPGLQRRRQGFEDYLLVLYRNSLVLALHALACVAGFIAGSSLPLAAAQRSGLSRWVHEKAGPLAIGFVVCATLFSLTTQAYIIGGTASSIAGQLGVAPGTLLLALVPHALPELVALFLPLAAWMLASRRGDWQDLLGRDLRDGGDRSAGAAGRGRDRDLGLPALPARDRLLKRTLFAFLLLRVVRVLGPTARGSSDLHI